MQKIFTVQVPDELWVNSWELNNSVDYEYSGPDEVYALLDPRKVLITCSPESVGEDLQEGWEEIVIDASSDTAIAHFIVEINTTDPEFAHTFEDEVQPFDGSVYQKITNPRISDWFTLEYDHTGNGLFLEVIEKSLDTPLLQKAKEKLRYVERYNNEYEFGDDISLTIQNFLESINSYIASLETIKPWKHLEISEVGLPKVPVSLISAFSSLPDPAE